MINPCTCKAEHWQPHAESCPAYKPKPLTNELPRIPPKHLKDGCYARADALEAHLNAAKMEITQLRGNLSLAEEGLASAVQEAERWKAQEQITYRAAEREYHRLRDLLRRVRPQMAALSVRDWLAEEVDEEITRAEIKTPNTPEPCDVPMSALKVTNAILDDVVAERDQAERSLRNCLQLAGRRIHKGSVDKEWWAHIERFCKEAGVEPSILRDELKSGVQCPGNCLHWCASNVGNLCNCHSICIEHRVALRTGEAP
jgi:hypothetical protein